MVRVASMPFMPGIEMSMTTTCGNDKAQRLACSWEWRAMRIYPYEHTDYAGRNSLTIR